MPLSNQNTKLPKWPFFLGDAALLATAWLIGSHAPQPMPIDVVVAVTACVVCATIAGILPFLADYARRQDEALDERQRSLEALGRTVAASAEQIGIAAAGWHELADLAQKNLKQAEQIPIKLQDKVAELGALYAKNRDREMEELEKKLAALKASDASRIEAAAERIVSAAANWPGRAEAARKPPAPVEAEPPAPPPAPEEAAPAAEAGPEPAAAPAPESPAPAAETPPEPPPPPRKRAPRKPKPQEAPPAAAPAVAAPAEAAPGEAKAEEPMLPLEDAAPGASEFSQVAPEEAAPTVAVSADGATRLLVTAYIGIGNRLFIRGDGPGLSWDKGVPLQFVSIGKWRWETADATGPVAFKLYKNDDIECTSLKAPPLEPGKQHEVTAGF